MENEDATIVTFYSYKGGVGRSMAVANVAWMLAEKFHKRVLVVDWDLEAPGLHRFFNVQDSEVSKGLIELFNDYKALVREEQKSLPEKLVEVSKYIQTARVFREGGKISILAAGKQDKNYATEINQFSWEEFYAKWHGFGFIEYLKKELKKLPEVDIVIVDSRTGVTDIGGICTLQLPDIVVLLFALNDQNIEGVKLVAQRISEKALEIEGRDRPPALLIRPARVERTGNQEEKIRWQGIAATKLGEYVHEDDPKRLMAKRNIPYIGDYSYGETPLAVEKDPLGDMAEAFEDLADSILRTAGRENAVAPRKPFLAPLAQLSQNVRWFMRSGRNVAIVVMALLSVGLVVAVIQERRKGTSLSAELAQLKEPAVAEPAAAPVDWNTKSPTRAWCYQHGEPITTYMIKCYWSKSRCDSGRNADHNNRSECAFIRSLPSLFRVGNDEYWYLYTRDPITELPVPIPAE